MGLSCKEMLNKIVLLLVRRLLGDHSLHSFSSTGLHPIFAGSRSLDIPTVTQSHDHAVIGNQILDSNLPFIGKNRAATRSGMLFFNLEKLILNNGEHSLLPSKNVEKIFDILNNRIVFGLDLVLLHRGQLIKP